MLVADHPAAQPRLLDHLQALLKENLAPLTCRELLGRWPGTAPRADSLWRVLARDVELGVFSMIGKGTKTEPFRFTLVSRPNAAEAKLP